MRIGAYGPMFGSRLQAINMLRRFYEQENPNAPEPRRKDGRTATTATATSPQQTS